jgi:hypothetical protein
VKRQKRKPRAVKRRVVKPRAGKSRVASTKTPPPSTPPPPPGDDPGNGVRYGKSLTLRVATLSEAFLSSDDERRRLGMPVKNDVAMSVVV